MINNVVNFSGTLFGVLSRVCEDLFIHGAVGSRPYIARGEGDGKKIDKVGFTQCGSILSILGFVTASFCNILLEQ